VFGGSSGTERAYLSRSHSFGARFMAKAVGSLKIQIYGSSHNAIESRSSLVVYVHPLWQEVHCELQASDSPTLTVSNFVTSTCNSLIHWLMQLDFDEMCYGLLDSNICDDMLCDKPSNGRRAVVSGILNLLSPETTLSSSRSNVRPRCLLREHTVLSDL